MTARRRRPAAGSSTAAERQALLGVMEGSSGVPRAAVVALVVLGAALLVTLGLALRERDRAGDVRTELAAAAVRADSLDDRLAALEAELARRPRPEDLLAILAAPDLVDLELRGSDEAAGRILADASRGLVLARGLDRSGGTRFALWHVGPEGPRRVATLEAGGDGTIFAFLDEVDFLQGWGALRLTEAEVEGEPTLADAALEYRGRLR